MVKFKQEELLAKLVEDPKLGKNLATWRSNSDTVDIQVANGIAIGYKLYDQADNIIKAMTGQMSTKNMSIMEMWIINHIPFHRRGKVLDIVAFEVGWNMFELLAGDKINSLDPELEAYFVTELRTLLYARYLTNKK